MSNRILKSAAAVFTACVITSSILPLHAEETQVENDFSFDFKLSDLGNYKREFKYESIGACSTSSTKTYEDYRAITSTGSLQYQYIHNHMKVDDTTGFLYNEDGFIAVAMAYGFGEIGTEYYIVLDTGNIIPVVVADFKSAVHASNGCSANSDGSVIEFVIDSTIAKQYFGGSNGLASSGNFNNYKYLNGSIQDIEKVLDEKLEDGVIYEEKLVDDARKSDEIMVTMDHIIEGGY